MFISIKKKAFIYTFVALLIISILAICLAAREVKDDVEADYEAEPISVLNEKIVLIDPGHGGFDAGASGNGLYEKDVNLSVALLLRDKVNEKGGVAVLTRDTDVSTANESDKGSKKASDLKRRKAMVSEKGADIMVSIHMNKFEQAKYWGVQVFYGENSPESKVLGETIQETVKEFLNDGNKRVAKESNGKIFLLKNVEKPTVIVECGFLSNTDEARKLSDESYQKMLAEGICLGIERFFDTVLP